MRRLLWIAAAAALLLGPLEARAQQPDQSLAAAARKAREQKKDAPKAVKVFNNDNLPASGPVSVVGAPPAETTPAVNAAAATAEGAAPATGEQYWRGRFADVRKKIQQTQSELAIMQRELGRLQVLYYPDPQKAMNQQYSLADIKAKQDKIDAKQKELNQLNQQLSDLEDDLRKSGGDPGWAR
jgi:DNA repair exonuclease SbcCD ATPase subunit